VYPVWLHLRTLPRCSPCTAGMAAPALRFASGTPVLSSAPRSSTSLPQAALGCKHVEEKPAGWPENELRKAQPRRGSQASEAPQAALSSAALGSGATQTSGSAAAAGGGGLALVAGPAAAATAGYSM
jgi:hypothetical protein